MFIPQRFAHVQSRFDRTRYLQSWSFERTHAFTFTENGFWQLFPSAGSYNAIFYQSFTSKNKKFSENITLKRRNARNFRMKNERIYLCIDLHMKSFENSINLQIYYQCCRIQLLLLLVPVLDMHVWSMLEIKRRLFHALKMEYHILALEYVSLARVFKILTISEWTMNLIENQ